jgi:hypothetical protein
MKHVLDETSSFYSHLFLSFSKVVIQIKLQEIKLIHGNTRIRLLSHYMRILVTTGHMNSYSFCSYAFVRPGCSHWIRLHAIGFTRTVDCNRQSWMSGISTVWKIVLLNYCFSKKVKDSGFINCFSNISGWTVGLWIIFWGKLLRVYKITDFILKQQHF